MKKKPNRSSFWYKLIRQYPLYLLRWQLSTPILAVVVAYLAYLGEWIAASVANLIGGLIFFWADRFIFRPRAGVRIRIEWHDEVYGKLVQSKTVKNARYIEIDDCLYIPLLTDQLTPCSILKINVSKGKQCLYHCWNAITGKDLIENKYNTLILKKGENSESYNRVCIAKGDSNE